MKWSDVPFSIEVRRDGSPWSCVGRVKSQVIADISASHLWRLIYAKLDGSELRVVVADRANRTVTRSYPK